MNYSGVIIEESLKDKAVLKQVEIVKTKIEPVTEHHRTPWLKQWTLHTVDIPVDKVVYVTDLISKSLDRSYWYADYKNDEYHYIIFPDKVFKVDRSNPDEYNAVVEHGLSLGIPNYQLDFSPAIKQWARPKE